MKTIVSAKTGLYIMILAVQHMQASDAVPESVERYSRDLQQRMSSPVRTSLESVFREGLSAATALERASLADLKDSTYRKVRGMMAGFSVSRGEIVVVAPLPDFFLRLAKDKGMDSDIAFFESLKKTHPDGIHPAYYSPQTDYGGCIIFDGRTLTGLYSVWTEFRKAHPTQYRAESDKELVDIEGSLKSTCVCGDEDGFSREIETFLKAHPTSQVAPQLAAELGRVRAHASEVEFNCKAR